MPSYIKQEKQYASNIIPDTEVHVDTEMPYEDWLAAEGLVELHQLPLKDTKGEENESMAAKQIDSIHMTLGVIYEFIQDNTISSTDRDDILRKLNAICKCVEEQDSQNKEDDIKCEIEEAEKKDGEVAEGLPKVNEFIKHGINNAIDKMEKKDREVADGGQKVKELIKHDTNNAIDKVEKKRQ